ncbi:Non-repetitive/WGA-negative nucleoporin C-terminal-domain-containing protein [Pseudoneurospora amorphoporcata]|uniref:Non-repetitive/WGA-negative nucleoporin C-terminal-domain-containing protein n=1 Tax=Pseudoneurospora amorphoporcata TaxID=241081 RepID=A0AAN6P4U5_9PEZI|nr:Non-repetitive/WGA-negative nucleoporin C-terminal-domain-containing protein [Pseudoneurospora amorphoporcata]
MFEPNQQDQGGPAKGTRSSRRRARPSSNTDATIQAPKAKRQRVPLHETTVANTEALPETDLELDQVKSDKVLVNIKRDGNENLLGPRKELSVRSKKQKAGERTAKGDGSIVLTTNSAYTVSKLPALPDRLRADAQNRQHGAVYSTSGYALSLTHTHAFVWPYASTAASPETFTFGLPYPSKNPTDPLPLGSLVSPSAASDEPGLVVVMPMSGKIAYWESISSAATLDFIRQQRHGVEDTIPGMFSGEYVVQIVNAESAGFVLVFSSGRLAYLSVRDMHGRPTISVQFLRSSLTNAVGGLLGSIRHVLGSTSAHGDVVAVRASHAARVGERVIVAATTKGKFNAWRIHRGGHHDALSDIDLKSELIHQIQEADLTSAGLPEESFEVVDFTCVPRGLDRKYVEASRLSEALVHDEDSVQHLLLLTSFSSKTQSRYALVEVVISGQNKKVGAVRPLTSYTSPVRLNAPERPKLYLPRPAMVAFVVFDRAVVIASLAAPPDSPESQLQEDSHIIPATFEDVVDLRDEGNVQIVGSGTEEPTTSGHSQDELRLRHRTKNPAAVLLVQGVGTVRVAVSEVDRFASEMPPTISAKSKLEQAVFFGVKHDNPLVFQGRSLPFTAQEIGNAAIELSHEIVASKTPFIPNVPASLENNMRTRVDYLERLISHLNTFKVDLDARTRWTLLYDSEKMAVATWLWRKNEQFIAERPKGDKKNLLSETVLYINEKQKTEPNPAIGEVDPVRHWFMNDVWKLEIFIAWPYQIIKYAYTERLTDENGINRLVWEAAIVNKGALQEAEQHRLRNARLYGVNPRKFAQGIGMPAPWTGIKVIHVNLKRLIEFCYEWLDNYYLPSPEKASVDVKILKSIRDMLPALTSRYFTALNEYISWAEKSSDPEIQEDARKCIQAYPTNIYEKILRLKDYDLWDEAIALAQEHEAYAALADVMVQHILMLEESALAPGTSTTKAEECHAKADDRKRQMGGYFNQYQERFAFPAYEALLEASGVQAVLEFPYDTEGYATKFLRSRPELAKISWINDVERENDIARAAETLLTLGLTQEQQVWSKKIELSLGKLALLAEEADQRNGDSEMINGFSGSKAASIEKVDQALEVIAVQNGLYSQIRPTIAEAVDERAEFELAMKYHGAWIHAQKKQKALQSVFEDGMERLLKHEALSPLTLIDLLTLVYLDPKHFEAIGDQFYLALKVAKHGLKGEERSNAERLIWRRCLIRDDWKQVNVTNLKDDEHQLQVLGETAVYRTLFAVVDERKFQIPPSKHPSNTMLTSLAILEHSNDAFRPCIKPSDALGVFTDSLDRRFDGMDDSFRHKLMDSMKAEDVKLKTYIDKARLDEWFKTTLEAAENTVALVYGRMTAKKAAAAAIAAHGSTRAPLESASAGAVSAGSSFW